MLKWISTALLLLLASVWVDQDATAELVPVSVDGCTELAKVVYAEVSAAILYGPGKSGPWVVDQGQGDIAMCGHTTKTVSRAFTLAMNSAGFYVTWGHGKNRNGDYCWSRFLSRCYPDRNSDMITTLTDGATLVQQTWNIVSRAIMRHMHNPHSSDEIRFRDNDLKMRLGLSLRSLVNSGQHKTR